MPQLFWTQVFAAAVNARAGHMKAAREAAHEARSLYPDLAKEWDSQTGMHSWSPHLTAVVTDGLRRAGLFDTSAAQ